MILLLSWMGHNAGRHIYTIKAFNSKTGDDIFYPRGLWMG